MSKFIELTQKAGGSKLLVAISSIETIRPYSEGEAETAAIHYTTSADEFDIVAESYSAVKFLLGMNNE
jgi:hypothetical protein